MGPQLERDNVLIRWCSGVRCWQRQEDERKEGKEKERIWKNWCLAKDTHDTDMEKSHGGHGEPGLTHDRGESVALSVSEEIGGGPSSESKGRTSLRAESQSEQRRPRANEEAGF